MYCRRLFRVALKLCFNILLCEIEPLIRFSRDRRTLICSVRDFTWTAFLVYYEFWVSINSLNILAWEVRCISKYCQSQRHTQGKFGSDAHFHFVERAKVGICPRNPIPIEAISYAQEFQGKASIPYHSQRICTHGMSKVSLRAITSAASKPKSCMCRESRWGSCQSITWEFSSSESAVKSTVTVTLCFGFFGFRELTARLSSPHSRLTGRSRLADSPAPYLSEHISELTYQSISHTGRNTTRPCKTLRSSSWIIFFKVSLLICGLLLVGVMLRAGAGEISGSGERSMTIICFKTSKIWSAILYSHSSTVTNLWICIWTWRLQLGNQFHLDICYSTMEPERLTVLRQICSTFSYVIAIDK